jgi:hypothetical protein
VFDNVRSLPPCGVCGSSEVKKDDLHVDWVGGKWKGEWTCKNGHRNVFE